MEMSAAEIKRRYEKADGRRKRLQQLSILAELNGCARYDIAKIIYDAGGSDITKSDLERFKRSVEKDMRKVIEAGASRKEPETVAPTQCQPAEPVNVWEQDEPEIEQEEDDETGQQETEREPTKKGETKRRELPSVIVDALIFRMDALDEDMRQISQKQKELAEEMKQKETEYLEICGFIGIGPQAAEA